MHRVSGLTHGLLSESQELDKAIFHLSEGRRDTAIRILERLREQVRHGYHKNGTLAVVNPPIPGGKRRAKFEAGMARSLMSEDVHEIRYTHADDGRDYYHPFEGDVEMWAVLRNGRHEILLTHAAGQPLWEEF
jgi:hypothetical protein